MGGGPPASAPARRRARARRSSLLVVGLLLAAPAARAQQQPVLLELRPRAGDTLHVRVDQEVEMTGTRRVGGADSTMTVVTTMQVRTRCVVERADAAGSTILATTDSVRIASTGEHARETERARRALQGRTVRLQIAPDGSARVVDDAAATSTPGDIPAVFAQMPATLPRRAVAVGESWTRQIAIPRAGAASGVGTLRATFRLDSLSRGGDLAYVSMRGSLARDAAGGRANGTGRGGADSSRLEMVGVVSGGMTIDRRRGWMTDARTTLSVRSRVPPSPDDRGGTPMVVRLKMTQWLRTY